MTVRDMTKDEKGGGAADDPALFYERHVFCCNNERAQGHPRGCCAAGGAQALRDYMKQQARRLGKRAVRINQAGCLDRCELGPVMVIYPEGVWYAYRTQADVDEIIQTHLIDGGRVERLMLKPEDVYPADRAGSGA